jgi:hypothetical protein
MRAARFDVRDIVHGKASGEHESISDVIHGWQKREKDCWLQNGERRKSEGPPLPSAADKDFRYGMSTRELDMKADPLHRSNAIIEQRIAAQERKREREERKQAPQEKPLPQLGGRPTAASRAHARAPRGDARPAEQFKLKRFANIEHGKVDSNFRKRSAV